MSHAAPGPADDGGRKKRILLGAAGGCLLLVGMCCVCPVAGYVGGNAKAKGEVEDAVETWLAHVRAGEWDAAYDGMDTWYHARRTREQLVEDLSACASVRSHTSASIEDVTVDHPFDDFVIVRAEIAGGATAGTEALSIGVEREDDGWKIGTFSSLGGHRCSL